MKALLLLSLVVALVAVPLRLAAEPRPRRALRRMAMELALFTLFYLAALRFIYPRLL